MEIRVVDFDSLTRNYKNYQDGIADINLVRKDFLAKAEPLKKEMEEVINSLSEGILDPKSQKEQEFRFRALQDKAMEIDNEFKSKMREQQSDLSKVTFDELSEIINEWSLKNSIDMVIGKMEVVFLTEKYEATNQILEILKERNLYTEIDALA
jgi:Skp family chaperone for outer membrane proteins